MGFLQQNILPEFLTKEVAIRFMAFPLDLVGDMLVVAIADPDNFQSIQDLEIAIQRPVLPLLASFDDIASAINRNFSEYRDDSPKLEFGAILNTLGIADISSIQIPLELDTNAQSSDALAWFHNIPYLDLDKVTLQPGLTALIPWEKARNASAIPLWWLESGLYVGISNPDYLDALSSLSDELGLRIFPLLCDSDRWEIKFGELYLQGIVNKEVSDRDIANFLCQKDLISNEELKRVLIIHQQSDKPVKDVVLDLELVTIRVWEENQAFLLNLPIANLNDFSPKDFVNLIPPYIARACGLLPLRLEGKDKIYIGIGDYKPGIVELVENVVGKSVELFFVDATKIQEYQKTFYKFEGLNTNIVTGPGLGELLLKAGLISNNQLKTLVEMGNSVEKRIGGHLN